MFIPGKNSMPPTTTNKWQLPFGQLLCLFWHFRRRGYGPLPTATSCQDTDLNVCLHMYLSGSGERERADGQLDGRREERYSVTINPSCNTLPLGFIFSGRDLLR